MPYGVLDGRLDSWQQTYLERLHKQMLICTDEGGDADLGGHSGRQRCYVKRLEAFAARECEHIAEAVRSWWQRCDLDLWCCRYLWYQSLTLGVHAVVVLSLISPFAAGLVEYLVSHTHHPLDVLLDPWRHGVVRVAGCMLVGGKHQPETVETVPFGQMDQEHTGGLFHGLDHYAGFGSHGRVCELQWVEVEHGIQDPVGRAGPCADQDGQAVESGINNEDITITKASAVSCDPGLLPHTDPHLLFSCKTLSILSSKPAPSASSVLASNV